MDRFFELLFMLVCICAITTRAQVNFEDHFSICRMSDPRFDNCIREGLNSIRPYLKTGLPQYGVRPFDPFHADEVVQTMQFSPLKYTLTLRNVTEAGWTSSQITRLRTDIGNNNIEFTHFFPDKRLNGDFEFDGELFGRKIRNQGTWNLKLFDYSQRMKVGWTPRGITRFGENMGNDLKVNVTVISCRHMEMHISNLLGGRPLIENIADRLINSAWPPGFILLRPLIGDLVSTAFTKIFNDNLSMFPFGQIIRV